MIEITDVSDIDRQLRHVAKAKKELIVGLAASMRTALTLEGQGRLTCSVCNSAAVVRGPKVVCFRNKHHMHEREEYMAAVAQAKELKGRAALAETQRRLKETHIPFKAREARERANRRFDRMFRSGRR